MLLFTMPEYPSSVNKTVLALVRQPGKPQASFVGTACATALGPRIRLVPVCPVCVLIFFMSKHEAYIRASVSLDLH